MRTFVSAAAVILSLLLAAVAVPTAWVDSNIVREDGFVRLTAALGKDQAFQHSLAMAAVGSLESAIELPAAAEQLAAGILEDAATSMQSWPEFPGAWDETIRKSHRLNFTDPSSVTEETPAPTSLILDVGPLVGLVAARLTAATGLPVDVPDAALINIGAPSQRQLVERAAAFAPLWWVPALGALVSLCLAFVAARRRSRLAVFAGLGFAVVAAVWTASAGIAGGVVGSMASGNPVAEVFKREFVAACQAGFGQWVVLALAGAGGLVALGAVAWAVSSGRRRTA
ncbi:hypothetical protein [Arthrobacter cavernae]|uniref:Integral membrane protein n=1 Tax=Arthrobacter cavernae TaxID=2817681 RepID=A0A939HDS3_9MICC|nr:hypothetical protein [Arthrobacter cavernae]MBO1267334.1 hypothetical protein [Arthrobacter cavernae]